MPSLADPAYGPLAPGKPAGIKQAQLDQKAVVFWGLLGAVAITGLYLAAGPNLYPSSATSTAP